MPNPSPNRQNRMPIRSNLCPSIAPLKKLTEDRSGSFSEASPPPPSGWARAVTVPALSSAATDEILFALQRESSAAVSSHVRINESSELDGFRNKKRV